MSQSTDIVKSDHLRSYDGDSRETFLESEESEEEEEIGETSTCLHSVAICHSLQPFISAIHQNIIVN